MEYKCENCGHTNVITQTALDIKDVYDWRKPLSPVLATALERQFKKMTGEYEIEKGRTVRFLTLFLRPCFAEAF
jgi:hypothetical protein